MFGFISKKQHDAEIETLATARDGLVECLNTAEKLNRELTGKLSAAKAENIALASGHSSLSDRLKRLQIDRDAIAEHNVKLAGEAEANARFVQIGKARLDALERAKAKRRAG